MGGSKQHREADLKAAREEVIRQKEEIYSLKAG